MKALLVILLLTVSVFTVNAEEALEFDFNKDSLSDKWYAGPNLIYDCEDKHWVCVTKVDLVKCTELRRLALKSGKRELDCVPGDVFERREECLARQKHLVSGAKFPRVCLHPIERSRLIGFQ
jgi:hypothetical protein